ncbi:MAG: hypothetical protein RKH07_12710 [Gammaproteobacteria bacterium]
MTAKRSAGVKIHISASTPATFDDTGYEALADFTKIGEVTRISGFGPRWNNETHNPLEHDGTEYLKTNKDAGALTVEMALDTDDAGQIKVKAARDSASAIASIRVEFPGGDDYYCQLVVNEFMPNPDTQSAKQTATMVGNVTCSSTGVGWVEALA